MAVKKNTLQVLKPILFSLTQPDAETLDSRHLSSPQPDAETLDSRYLSSPQPVAETLL